MEPDRPNGQSVDDSATNSDVDVASLSIVGVGASAGGLKAFSEFLAAMPERPGMAFVLVQHLAPNHESELAELLQNHTPLRVVQVEDGVEAEPGGVYVIPPGKALSIQEGVLHLAEPDRPHGRRAPIDDFFRSLAADQGERAVCVVLSGTGSDGTLGLKTLKEAGGLTMAQTPDDAEYDGMPQSAVSTGLVDVVLPARKLGSRLVELRRQGLPLAPTAEPLPEDDHEVLSKIFSRLRAGTGHDFSRYKQTTILRRIGRRMQVTGAADLAAYARAIREDGAEAEALLKDLLISVTNFFRDPEAFAVLEREAIPKMFAGKGPDEQVRVWVPGCATGEEAYSIAILLCEHAARLDDAPEIQVFATDIDAEALQTARAGAYPETIAASVSSERLDRFFEREGEGYRVKEALRERVLFAEHNLLKDPPFSRLDLVSCRNLLIYLQRETQERIFELFAYALRTPGFLFLGTSESVASTKGLFSTLDKRRRLFEVRGVLPRPRTSALPSLSVTPPRPQPEREDASGGVPVSLDDLHRRLLLRHHAPPSVIVNPGHEILHVAGDVSRYLTFAAGHPTTDLLKVARPALRPELRAALFHAAGKRQPTDRFRVRLQIDGAPAQVALTVRPLHEADGADGLVQIVFEEEPVGVPAPSGDEREASPAVEHLEDELGRTKDHLRRTIEEAETSNEELRASNEELLLMNEELQSTGEELETGREELQSLNEELQTVNQELKTKIEELNRANADLQNLIDSTDVATLFLDGDLRIVRYTPRLGELFNVRPDDRGRPIAHLTQNLAYPAFLDDARSVLGTLVPVEREVEGDGGSRFLTRIVPYRTLSDRVEGVVATFLDITRRVEAEEAANRREARFRRVVADAPIPVFLHAEDGEILQVSRAVTEITGYAPEELATLDAWVERAYGENAGRVAMDVERLYETDARVDEGEYRIHTKGGEERVWQFSSSPVGTDGRGRRLVVSMAADVTQRRRAEEARQIAIEGGRLGTWRRDLETDVVAFDDRCRALYGLPPNAPFEESFERVHPEDRATVGAAIEAALDPAGSGEYDMEHRIVRPDGEVRWMAARGRATFRGEGDARRPVAIAGVILDVTERKQNEAEREARARQQAALANFGLYALTETDTQALFDRAVAVVHETLGVDFAKILDLQPDGEALLLRAGIGWRDELLGTATVPSEVGSQAGYTLSVTEPVIVDDLGAETRFSGPALLTDHNVTSGMSVIIGGLEVPFGVFGVHTLGARTFSHTDADFLQSIANAVGSAAERIGAQQHLEARVDQRTRTLRESEARLRLLYDVVSRPADDLDAQIAEALRLTTEFLGLDVGILSRIDADDYTVEHAYAPDADLEPGQTFAVGDTSCAITLQAGEPVAISDFGASDYESHPCRDAFDVEAYVGAPVRVGGTVRGTLNFTAARPKTPPFSEGDRELVGLLARWLGSAFERRSAEAALRDEKERSERVIEASFDGIIAFDLDLRYTVWNTGIERITGVPREDVLGEVSYETFPILLENGDLERQRTALAGEPAISPSIPYSIPQTEKTGFYEARYSPLRDADGVIVGALGVIRDVTDQQRVREQVERSEQLLASVLIGSLESIVALEAIRDDDGDIEDFEFRIVNPAAADVYGRPAKDLIGTRYLDQVPGTEDAGVFGALVRVVETGTPFRDEICYDADGIHGWYDYTVVQLGDGVALTFRDVTEQKETERTIRESEARFRELFESSPDAIFVESIDGVVLDVNPAACRLHHTSREWLIGRDLGELVPPEYREQARADFERLARGELSLLESRSFTADGLVVPVEVRTDRITYAGQEAVLLHVRDVTERDAAERALRESEERFAKAFRSAPVAMTISTFNENRYLDVNASYCALTGYSRDEILGRTSVELGIVPEEAPSVPGFAQLGESGRVRDLEFPIHTKSGKTRDVLVSAELIDIGGLTCVLGIGFDVTDRKRLEREVIEAAEQERRRIGQDLHDELGQQLTGAAFLSEVLAQQLATAERAEAESAHQLTALINDILTEARDLSRLLSPVDIFADGLTDALQALADQTERIFDVTCVLDTEGDVSVSDNAAATHLYRIAQEAVNNAVKHAKPSSVRITLMQRAEGLRLRIEDDGSGIEHAELQQTAGIGLRTMRYRAALIGGVIQIGQTATGSEVSVLIPGDAQPPTER